jgi:O-antigen/teichoic acid export membrane protein
VKTEAQKWGETAVAFIASAAGTGIFVGLAYLLLPRVHALGIACCVAAALCFVAFAIKSITIMKWWIVIAQRERLAKSAGVDEQA